MSYEWIDEYLLAKKGVEKDFKEEWKWHRYMISGKLFCAILNYKDGRPMLTLKCEPSFGSMLRENYEEIVEGYYMNKVHWNSVFLDGNVPEDVIKQMIDMSYNLIFDSLTKKVQKSILS